MRIGSPIAPSSSGTLTSCALRRPALPLPPSITFCAACVPFSREDGGHLYVIVQTKKTDNAITVSLSDIQKWYDTVSTLTKKWRRDGNEVMYMFFTNKRLTDEAEAMMDQQFFLERPGLCVTSFDELDEVIPSLMRTRFVTA